MNILIKLINYGPVYFCILCTVILPILHSTVAVPYPIVTNRTRPFLIGFKTDRSETAGYGTGAVRKRLLERIGRITIRYRHRSFLTGIDHYLTVLDRSGNGYGQVTVR